jgi:hypothetical protein
MSDSTPNSQPTQDSTEDDAPTHNQFHVRSGGMARAFCPTAGGVEI